MRFYREGSAHLRFNLFAIAVELTLFGAAAGFFRIAAGALYGGASSVRRATESAGWPEGKGPGASFQILRSAVRNLLNPIASAILPMGRIYKYMNLNNLMCLRDCP
jgi:hypothetical protein